MKLLVLLSSFNGAAYVREQLQSILDQDLPAGALSILVRDDGSQDRTIAILEALADPRVEITRGAQVGAKASFLALLAAARDRGSDYIALADQDDVWLSGKLARAVDRLRRAPGPALYCSALDLVDTALSPRGRFVYPGTPRFERAFLTNCVSGCTCVFNSALLNLLHELPRPEEILMHDWWLYLVAAAFGEVIYDTESYILYRQHGGNQIGRGQSVGALVVRGLKFARRPHYPHRLSQAREFARLYGHALNLEQRNYLDRLLECKDPWSRARFALRSLVDERRGLDEALGLAGFLMRG